MKLIIFGSTGKIGRQLVSQALEQKHEVTAFARSPEKLELTSKNLKVITGDVLDKVSVTSAVQGQDCVICALGMPLFNKDGLRAKGTKNIIQAMQNTDCKRIVCLSGFGANESRAMLPLHYRLLIIPLLMRHPYADHELQEKYLRASPLDWILIRPAGFTNGQRTGDYWHGTATAGRRLKLKISQADVAEFMLKQIEDNTYLRQAPILSY